MHSLPRQQPFRAKLDFFYGPVELLLWLVRHGEVAADRVMRGSFCITFRRAGRSTSRPWRISS